MRIVEIPIYSKLKNENFGCILIYAYIYNKNEN